LLAEKLGVSVVAERLRLNCNSLKRHLLRTEQYADVELRKISALSPKAYQANFVEVKGIPGLSGPANTGALVEIAAPDGTRLTIRMMSGNPDFAALVSAFREFR